MEQPQRVALGAVSRSLDILNSLPLEGLSLATVSEIQNLVQTTQSVAAMLKTSIKSSDDLAGFAVAKDGAPAKTFAHQRGPGNPC